MSSWDDVLIGLFVFFVGVILTSLFSLGFPALYYVNMLVPAGTLFLYTGDRFLFRLLLLLGIALLFEVFSFVPFGLWFLRVSLLLGVAFFWIEVFSKSTVSMVTFFFAYPFLELLFERFVVTLAGFGGCHLLWAILGKSLNALLSFALFSLWLRWEENHVE